MLSARGASVDEAPSAQDNRIVVRRGGSRVGPEKSDTLVHDVPGGWAGRAHADGVIQFAPGLPKTRSGKIMRRILRKIAVDEVGALGDASTLADPAVVDDLVKNRPSQKGGAEMNIERATVPKRAG
jgi:hypothetical protein